MKFINARQSIHDAFAIHMTTGEWLGGGSNGFDSTKQTWRAMKAGLVIEAVLSQPDALRGIAMLMNCPDGMASDKDIRAMREEIWSRFVKASEFKSDEEMLTMKSLLEKVIIGCKFRAWNHDSKVFHTTHLVKLYSEGKQKRISRHINRLIDIITDIDGRSLVPVWEVIAEQRRRYEAAN